MNVDLMIQKSTQLKRENKGYLSNAFYTIPQWKEMEDKGVLSIYEGDGSIWVSIREDNIYRLVFFSESIESIGKMDFSVFGDANIPIVLEFLDKKNQVDTLRRVLEKKAFRSLKCLYRMYCSSVKFGYRVENAIDYWFEIAQKEDAQSIYDLLYTIFDVRISRLPSLQTILDDIEENHVFVVRDGSDICGIAYFQRQGAKAEYLYQLAITEMYRGKKLPYSLLQYAIESLGIEKRYTVWVEADNPKGIHIYKKMGFQEDGLKEHIFQLIERKE